MKMKNNYPSQENEYLMIKFIIQINNQNLNIINIYIIKSLNRIHFLPSLFIKTNKTIEIIS